MDAITFFALFIKFGWGIIPLLLLVVAIVKPEIVDRWKSVFILPFFKIFKIGARQYIGSRTSFFTTSFYQNAIRSIIPNLPELSIKIKWINREEDIIEKNEGQLVLYLRETGNQAKNVLSATKLALPRIVCPLIRSRVDKFANDSIDLTILRKLSHQLGNHTIPLFHNEYLKPVLLDDVRIAGIFNKLVEIDNAGTFVTIFLDELNSLGERLEEKGTIENETDEILNFIEYLYAEATRETSEEIRLSYISKRFKVGIVLLAIGLRARSEGLHPYITRVFKDLDEGCDSIYIVSYNNAFDLFDKLISTLNNNERLSLSKNVKVKYDNKGNIKSGFRKIALFRRVPLFTDQDFIKKIESNNVSVGKIVNARVTHVSTNYIFLEYEKLRAVMHKSESNWTPIISCHEIANENDHLDVEIIRIDSLRSQLEMSRKISANDPLEKMEGLVVGDEIKFKVKRFDNSYIYAEATQGYEVIIPYDEYSWLPVTKKQLDEVVNTEMSGVVLDKSEEKRAAVVSVKNIKENPWDYIQSKYSVNMKLRCEVVEILPYSVRVFVEKDIFGFVSQKYLEKAGYEYSDFQETLQIGQKLDLYIKQIIPKKKKIIFDLERNKTNQIK